MDNKNTIIAICVALLLLTVVFACSRGCETKPSKVQSNPPPLKTGKPEVDFTHKERRDGLHTNTNFQSSVSHLSYSYDEPKELPSSMTDAKLALLKRKYAEEDRKLKEASFRLAESKLKDTSLDPQALEQYKIKANKDFTRGMLARKKKDYKLAIRSFYEVLKDKTISPITRYFAFQNLMDIAKETHDIDLYFIAARMNANLLATEDLSLIGIEKNEDALEWVTRVELTLKAVNDPKSFEECVKLQLGTDADNVAIDELSRKEAEEEVRRDIAYYSEIYKELLK